MSGPTPPIALRPTKNSLPVASYARRSTARSPRANQCRAVPPGPMPADRQCAPRSSTSSPARKARWAYSSAPSAWPEREPRSASPTSSTTCSEWLGWLPRPHQPDPKDPLPSRPRAPHHRPNPPTTAQPNAQLSFRLDRPVIGGLQLSVEKLAFLREAVFHDVLVDWADPAPEKLAVVI